MAATNGDDVLDTVFDGEILHGLRGNDILNSSYNDTQLYGDDGDDQLTTKFAYANFEALALAAWQYGGRGNDQLTAELGAPSGGSTTNIYQYGGLGDDIIKAVAFIADYDFSDTADISIEVHGGSGSDIIDVSASLDGTNFGSATNTVFGDSGNDTIKATGYSSFYGMALSVSNILDAGSGDDYVEAYLVGASNGGDDLYNYLYGGFGADTLKADSYTNSNAGSTVVEHELFGGGGNDVLQSTYGSSGADGLIDFMALLDGGTGDDSIIAVSNAMVEIGIGYATVHHTLIGGAGNDGLNSQISSSSDYFDLQANLSGGAGKDMLSATIDIWASGSSYPPASNANNSLQGDDGNDALNAVITYASDYQDADINLTNDLHGGRGNDTLNAEIHANVSYDYADWIATYSVGSNQLWGGAGNDVITALIDAQHSSPSITLTGSSELYGEDGNDSLTVFGGTRNILDGGRGNDTLVGGDGQDTLIGGLGADTLTGGLEADTFLFDVLETSARKDTILDFITGEDLIALNRTAFAAFAGDAAGALDPNAFTIGAAASTSSQHVIYNSSTGALFYDADGVGGAAQVQIAQLSNKAVLSSGDIVLI